MKLGIKKILSQKGVQHGLFWLLSLLFVSWNFSISNEIGSIDIIYALFFHISLVPVVYITTTLLIPQFLQKNRFVWLSIFAASTIATGYFIHELVFEVVVPSLPIDYFIVSFVDPLQLISILIIYMALVTLLYLSKSWFYIEKIKSVNTTMELHNLRLQINPHFLLNSLNSIYGLTLESNKRAPEAVLQLSDLLKHMLYQKEQLVEIGEEVEQIKNYVALQQLRLNIPEQVNLKITSENLKGKIIPFLLLTFVENAFKHSNLQRQPSGFITIQIAQEESFYFCIENTFNPDKKQPVNSGIGLSNALRRLELIYPESHELNIDHKHGVFKLELKLPL